MRYFGGKARIGKQIAEFINSFYVPNAVYLEPFVGGAWVMFRVDDRFRKIGSDACRPLIDLYNALLQGWQPPDDVTREMYKDAKDGKLSPELTAFIGFGCSFAGKWFGGYASTPGRNYAKNAKNSLNTKLKGLQDSQFNWGSYEELIKLSPTRCVIYCDPPYAGTTGYSAVGTFDFDKFWQTMRDWSRDNVVIVSEYNAPEDFECVLAIQTKTDIRSKTGKEPRLEKLFMMKNGLRSLKT